MRTAIVTAAGGRRRSLALAAVAGTTEADEHQGRGPVRATRRGASSPRCAAPYGQHLGGESARSHGREHMTRLPWLCPTQPRLCTWQLCRGPTWAVAFNCLADGTQRRAEWTPKRGAREGKTCPRNSVGLSECTPSR